MRLRRLGFVLALAAVAGLGAAQAQQAPYDRQQAPYGEKPPGPYSSPYPSPYPPSPFPFPLPDPAARDMMIRGAEQIIRALELMLLAIPTYDPPVMTPDGDIIIKRRRGRPVPPPDVERTSRPGADATEL